MNAPSFTPGGFRLVVKRSRTGRGLFAGSPIPEGACVVEYVGPTLEEWEWEGLATRFLFAVSETRAIDGSSRRNIARYANHSCAPNCGTELWRGRVFLRALRDIAPGEELTYDYGVEYFEEFIAPGGCRCLACEPPAVG